MEHLASTSPFTFFVNAHGVAFLLESVQEERRSRKRPAVRHSIFLTCKRYAEAADCTSRCQAADPFCKCAWKAAFEVTGCWGRDLPAVLQAAVAAADSLARCSACQVLTAWTPGGLCLTCLLQSGERQTCPICHEAAHLIVRLLCGHHLCILCSRRLYFASEDSVRCPCCRAEQSKAALAAAVPPTPITESELPPPFRPPPPPPVASPLPS